MISSARKVLVRRRYRASRVNVFRAFTEPALLTRWFSPSVDIVTEAVDFEMREGGCYKLDFRFPDGHKNCVRGTFAEVARPERHRFTWTWDAPDPHAGIETLVTIELREYGEETEVVVTHERFPDEETRSRHHEGWTGAFDRLANLIDSHTL